MDRSSRQRINKAIEVLNDTIEQLDLTDIFSTLHPIKAEYSFFLSAHKAFSKIEHIIRHKANLKKFKSIEFNLSIYSDHSNMKHEINHRKRNEKKVIT